MKHMEYFRVFLRDEVNLNQSRLDRLNSSVKAVSGYLKNNLASYRRVERQGSLALRTIIKPVQDSHEYDADILLYMTHDADASPSAYISDLYSCLKDSKTYKEKVHRRTRCVVLDYAGDFHLDVVPCVTIDDIDHICNRKTDDFEETDGTGYRDWFNGKNGITNGHLKRVTRLLKFLRDHKRNFTAKSILLTTLIGEAVSDEDNFQSVPDTLRAISNHINEFLQDNDDLPEILNPALPDEDFTRHWDQAKYENFRDRFNSYTDRINEAFDTSDHDESVEKWRGVFGDEFGQKKEKSSDAKGMHSVEAPSVIPVTPVKPWMK